MFKIDVDKEQVTQFEKGFIVGLEGDDFNLVALGSMTLNEALEINLSLLAHTLRVFDDSLENKNTQEIYDAAVSQFSFMIDKFFPEAKSISKDFDTEVRLKAIEDGILQDKSK